MATIVLRGVPELTHLWDDALDRMRVNVTDPPAPEAFAAVVAGVSGVDASHVVATHGAANGITHALSDLDADAPVYLASQRWAIPVLRSGHRPVLGPPPLGLGPAGVVVASPLSAPRWEQVGELAGRFTVVVDDTMGFVDADTPVAAMVTAGATVVDSMSLRLGAPGLRLGWVVAGPRHAALVAESVRCESKGISQAVLELGCIGLAMGPSTSEAIRATLRRRRADLGIDDAEIQGIVAWVPVRAAGDVAVALAAEGVAVLVDAPRSRIGICLGADVDFATVGALVRARRCYS